MSTSFPRFIYYEILQGVFFNWDHGLYTHFQLLHLMSSEKKNTLYLVVVHGLDL